MNSDTGMLARAPAIALLVMPYTIRHKLVMIRREIPEELTREFVASVINNRGRRVNLEEYIRVYPDELLKGALVTGSIGSGKTEKAKSLVKAAIEQRYGALIFRHATDRQDNLTHLSKMVKSMKSLKELSEEEMGCILDYLKQKLTVGEIVEAIWFYHQRALRLRIMKKVLKDKGLL